MYNFILFFFSPRESQTGLSNFISQFRSKYTSIFLPHTQSPPPPFFSPHPNLHLTPILIYINPTQVPRRSLHPTPPHFSPNPPPPSPSRPKPALDFVFFSSYFGVGGVWGGVFGLGGVLGGDLRRECQQSEKRGKGGKGDWVGEERGGGKGGGGVFLREGSPSRFQNTQQNRKPQLRKKYLTGLWVVIITEGFFSV